MSKTRAGLYFPHQANELRTIAELAKKFCLLGCTTTRVDRRLKQIADEVDGKAEFNEPRPQG